MQPTQGCSWRQVCHNGLDWNLQIDAVLAFSSQWPSLRNIKPASGVIFTAHLTQTNTSRSGVIFTAHLTQTNTSRSGVFFAQRKCYYALKLTTFGLRLNLIQLFSTLFCVYTGAQFSDLYGLPFLYLLSLVHFTLIRLYVYALICLYLVNSPITSYRFFFIYILRFGWHIFIYFTPNLCLRTGWCNVYLIMICFETGNLECKFYFLHADRKRLPRTFVCSANADAFHWTWRRRAAESDVTFC